MGVLGMQLNILIIKTHTLNMPFFSCVVTGSVKLVHGPLASYYNQGDIIK